MLAGPLLFLMIVFVANCAVDKIFGNSLSRNAMRQLGKLFLVLYAVGIGWLLITDQGL